MTSPVEKSVQSFNDAYLSGSGWFDFFADDATIYPVNSTEPIKGRDSYRSNFENRLSNRQREASILSQDTHVTENTAIVMQLIQVVEEGVVSNVRESTIWNNQDGAWKIAHLHASLVGAQSSETPPDAGTIRVLAEKIPAVSSAVGLAQ